jgi:hypothetical protein
MDQLSAGLITVARTASGAAEQLHAVETETWEGTAAEAFRSIISDVPDRLGEAAAAFAEASTAVAVYADVLRRARSEARRAIDLYQAGESQTRQWEREWTTWRIRAAAADREGAAAPGPPGGTDPGSWERHEAVRIAAVAQASVTEAAERARARMHEAWKLAPDKPGFLSRALSTVGQFGLGVWGGVSGMGEMFWSLSPTRALLDPDGYVSDIADMGRGIAFGVTHPVEFGKAVANWDMWMENPARALGQLVPDLVITIATAGGGGAATAGRRSLDAVDAAADLGRAVDRVGDTTDHLTDLSRIRRIVDDVATNPVDIDRISPAPVWRSDVDPLWRADGRSPDLVFEEGFRPRDTTHLDLDDFVHNNTPSGFVSTSLDDAIYQGWPGARYRYDIDAPGGIDVNATLPHNRFATELEIAFPGGIDTRYVRGAREILSDGTLGPFIPNPSYSP